MASNTADDWRSMAFRQKVLSQIEEAVKKSGNPNVMMKNPSEMENQVYLKAKTKVDYLSYVARLLVYIRDIRGIRPTALGQQQPQGVNMIPQPGMRAQFPTPAITKQQGVGAMGGTQNTPQQLPMQHLQQAVKLPASLSQAQGQGQVFDRSGLTQQQLLSQHLLQQQMQAQTLLGQQQAARGFGSQGQMAHHQLSQSQTHVNVSAGQVVSPMPVQQQTVHQAQQPKHGVPRMPHIPSPTAATMSSTSTMRAPTPSSAQHTAHTSQPTFAPSPAPPFVPSPAMQHPSPSPQHGVAASPAAPASVPTPSTTNVQSPASILNPGSVGPVASPLNPAEEQAYLEKLQELQPYVQPLARMMNKLNRENRDKEHSSRELYKLKHLHDILTNKSKRLSLQALENSGNVLKKLITLKPPSVPTPPAPPTPSGGDVSNVNTKPGPTASTTTTASTVVLTQAICKPLYDAVSRHAKSPMLSHTLQRTFSPLLQAMEGPPITPLPPPAKKIKLADSNEKKCNVPHVLQGELARLCSRFQVKPGISTGVVQSNTLLQCSINDLNLPAVPPIEISVPSNYPYSSPECKTSNYNANPFLQKVQRQLSSRLQRMPDMYSVTSVLDAWESSIRLACKAEVAVN